MIDAAQPRTSSAGGTVELDLPRLEALRDLVAMEARRPSPVPRSLPTYFDRYRAASRASPRVPEPTGRSPRSLMWTKPRPQAASIAPCGT